MTSLLSVNASKSGRYQCTVLETAKGKHIAGSMVVMDIQTGHVSQRVLGQVGTVDTSNPIHMSPQFAPIIARQGAIPHISGAADVENATVVPIACIGGESGKHETPQANPPSGTPVRTLERGDLEPFKRERDWYANVGYQPGYEDVVISIACRDYGAIEYGGNGEAWHRLYVGRNGSGKTVVALTHLATRLVAHPALGALLLDTKGDLVTEGKHVREGFYFHFHELLRDGGRVHETIGADDLRLTSQSAFVDAATEVMRDSLRSPRENIEDFVVDAVAEIFGEGKAVNMERFDLEGFLDTCALQIEDRGRGWSNAKTRQDKAGRVRELSDRYKFRRNWTEQVEALFSGQYTPGEVAKRVLLASDIMMVDIPVGTRQELLVAELLSAVKSLARTRFHAHRSSGDLSSTAVNAEIVIDEAHRWVPQGGETAYSAQIIDAARTTRAYGVSWTFINQRMANIDKDVMSQCHTLYFLRGLGVGVDAKHLENHLGAEGLAHYRALDSSAPYFAMMVGSETNYGAGSAAPIAIASWGGNANQRLKEANPHIWTSESGSHKAKTSPVREAGRQDESREYTASPA